MPEGCRARKDRNQSRPRRQATAIKCKAVKRLFPAFGWLLYLGYRPLMFFHQVAVVASTRMLRRPRGDHKCAQCSPTAR